MRRNPVSDYDAELAVPVDMSLSLAQSGQMISSPSVMKSLPHAHCSYGSATRRNLKSDCDAKLAVEVDMSLSLAQSEHMISLPSVMRSLPHAFLHEHRTCRSVTARTRASQPSI